MTTAREHREEWRGKLQQFRDDVAAQGADWETLTAFAEALLAVLEGQSARLPADNPFQPSLAQVLAAISQAQP